MQQLRQYYLPCKHKTFLDNITNKKLITIARQILKLHQYDLASIEKTINNKKVLLNNWDIRMVLLWVCAYLL